MGTNEYSQPASKSSWDSQDFGDVNMVLKMAHFHKSSRPQWVNSHPDSKVYGAYMGPTWNRQDPGGPHVGPMILAIWVLFTMCFMSFVVWRCVDNIFVSFSQK